MVIPPSSNGVSRDLGIMDSQAQLPQSSHQHQQQQIHYHPRNISTLIDEYSSLTETFFSNFNHIIRDPSAQISFEPPAKILKKIVELDEKLELALDELQDHQRFQKKIIQVQSEIETCNTTLLQFTRNLEWAEKCLTKVLMDSNKLLENKRRAQQNPIDYEDLLSLAHRLAPFTSAPHNYRLIPAKKEGGDAPGGNAAPVQQGDSWPLFPPVPTDADLRRSLLFQKSLELFPTLEGEGAGKEEGKEGAEKEEVEDITLGGLVPGYHPFAVGIAPPTTATETNVSPEEAQAALLDLDLDDL